MEHRIHDFLQQDRHRCFGNPVIHSRNTERPLSRGPRLRYLHHPHRRRKIGPRRHPVPQLVQVGFQPRLELPNRLPIDSLAHPDSSSPASMLPRSAACRSQTASPVHLICPLASSQHRWLIKRPGSSRTRVRLPERTSGQPIPFAGGSPALRGRSSRLRLLRDGPTSCPATGTQPSQICCLGLSLPAGQPTPACLFRDEDLPRSALVPGPGSRHLSAGDRQASKQVTARLIRGNNWTPVLIPLLRFRLVISGFRIVVFPAHT